MANYKVSGEVHIPLEDYTRFLLNYVPEIYFDYVVVFDGPPRIDNASKELVEHFVGFEDESALIERVAEEKKTLLCKVDFTLNQIGK